MPEILTLEEVAEFLKVHRHCFTGCSGGAKYPGLLPIGASSTLRSGYGRNYDQKSKT